VERQLIWVTTVTEPALPAALSKHRSVRARQEAARRQNDAGMLSRARRLLFGTGETRPEPFPRPR
jgi:hypothetical protein